jgi:hypothetical protein
LWFEPQRGEKERQDCVQDDCRPKQNANKDSGEADVSEIQRDERAVGQHADQCMAGQASNSQSDQGDTGYASGWDSGARKFRT